MRSRHKRSTHKRSFRDHKQALSELWDRFDVTRDLVPPADKFGLGKELVE